MEIVVLKYADKKTAFEISALLSQLSSSRLPINETELRSVLNNPASEVVILKHNKSIIGTGSIFFGQTLYGVWAFIEDVVVDKDYRGQGLGEGIMLALIKRAKNRKIEGIRLTSRPERVAANRLYKKLGFKLKRTNYYALEF